MDALGFTSPANAGVPPSSYILLEWLVLVVGRCPQHPEHCRLPSPRSEMFPSPSFASSFFLHQTRPITETSVLLHLLPPLMLWCLLFTLEVSSWVLAAEASVPQRVPPTPGGLQSF